jgi:hypothetical protein
MNSIPQHISVLFAITVCITLGLFFKSARNSKTVIAVLLSWLIIQGWLGLSGFYTITDSIPPRFLLLIGPPVLLILVLFSTKSGKNFIHHLNPKLLTIMHVVRIPVELVLYALCIFKAVPELMTFEGRNFDILSGITAPIIYYWGYVKKQLSVNVLLAWNIVCLVLLFNIVVNAVLSAPLPFQQFAFNQPNKAVLYFPFNWLPSVIVPLVLFSHLVLIKQLVHRSEEK